MVGSFRVFGSVPKKSTVRGSQPAWSRYNPALETSFRGLSVRGRGGRFEALHLVAEFIRYIPRLRGALHGARGNEDHEFGSASVIGIPAEQQSDYRQVMKAGNAGRRTGI